MRPQEKREPDILDQPRREFVALAETSIAKILALSEEIARDLPEEVSVQSAVGRFVSALWHRLAEADGITTVIERAALNEVLAPYPECAAAALRQAGADIDWSQPSLLAIANYHSGVREHLLVEFEVLGYALASADRTFDHTELDALQTFLDEIARVS